MKRIRPDPQRELWKTIIELKWFACTEIPVKRRPTYWKLAAVRLNCHLREPSPFRVAGKIACRLPLSNKGTMILRLSGYATGTYDFFPTLNIPNIVLDAVDSFCASALP